MIILAQSHSNSIHICIIWITIITIIISHRVTSPKITWGEATVWRFSTIKLTIVVIHVEKTRCFTRGAELQKVHGWIDSIEWKVGLLEVGGDWRRWCSKRLGRPSRKVTISHQSLEKENHLRKGRKRGDMLVPWGVVWKGDAGKRLASFGFVFFNVFFNDFDVVLAKPWFKIGLFPTFGFVMFLFLADWRWLNCLDEDEWRWFVFRIEGSLCFAGIDDDGVNFLSCLDSRSLVWWKDGQCYCCDVDDDGHYILAWK